MKVKDILSQYSGRLRFQDGGYDIIWGVSFVLCDAKGEIWQLDYVFEIQILYT